MADIIIKNALIVTMDPERRCIRDGAIVVEKGAIVDVGKTSQIAKKYKARKTINASGQLATPGLINTHCHSSFFLAKNCVDTTSFKDDKMMFGFSYPWEGGLTDEDVRVGSLGLFIEMVKQGTTCFADPGAYHDRAGKVAEAMKEFGMRGCPSRTLRDRRDAKHPIPDNMFETTEETIRKNEKLIKDWNGAANGLIRPWFGLRFVNIASDELILKVKELADKYNVGIHAHAALDPRSSPDSVELTGLREVERLEKLGVLDKNVLLVHAGHVNDQEVSMIARRNAKVSHCPSSSMYEGTANLIHGMIPKMIKAGITVGLACDAVVGSNFQDMVRVAYIAATVHREILEDVTQVGAHKAMEMLTIDGAKALLWDDQIGSIEKGKRADIVLWDMKGMEWHPSIDPIQSLIYSADGSSAHTVMINGKLVMEKRKILTVNEDKIRTAVDKHSKEILDRIDVKPTPKWPIT